MGLGGIMATIADFCVWCQYTDYLPSEEPCQECLRETKTETLGLEFPVSFTPTDGLIIEIEDILGC